MIMEKAVENVNRLNDDNLQTKAMARKSVFQGFIALINKTDERSPLPFTSL